MQNLNIYKSKQASSEDTGNCLLYQFHFYDFLIKFISLRSIPGRKMPFQSYFKQLINMFTVALNS